MKRLITEMKEIGLQPSTSGNPGAKEAGQSVTRYILPDGRVVHAAVNRRYTCPNCGTSAWARPATKLICGGCYEEDDREITFLEPDASIDDEQEAA